MDRFCDLVKSTRTIRRFDEKKPINEDILLGWIDTARLTPSAGNIQPLKFMPVTGEENCKKVFPHLKWAATTPEFGQPKEGERPSAYIIILRDRNLKKIGDYDPGIAAMTLALSAREMDYGTCILKSLDRPPIKADFKIPDDLDIDLVLAFGGIREEVVIEDMKEGEKDTNYYNDEKGVHHVPKRSLKDLVIKVEGNI